MHFTKQVPFLNARQRLSVGFCQAYKWPSGCLFTSKLIIFSLTFEKTLSVFLFRNFFYLL